MTSIMMNLKKNMNEDKGLFYETELFLNPLQKIVFLAFLNDDNDVVESFCLCAQEGDVQKGKLFLADKVECNQA